MLLRLLQSVLPLVGLALAASAGAEPIRTAVPRASLNYLSIYAAEAKGFFKDEGLENETIAIGGPAAIAALLSGNVDFSGAGGSGLRAAAKGAAYGVRRVSAIQGSVARRAADHAAQGKA